MANPKARKNATNATRKRPKKAVKLSTRPKKAVTRMRAKQWPDVFISELRKRGIVLDAAKVARVNRVTAYRRKEINSDFAQQWTDALEDASDVMEAEAFRRAVKGVRKPVYQKGECVGYIQEYSDSLMALLLRANRPAKFNDRMRLDVYDWRAEARKEGIDPDEALNEFERIIADQMEKRNDGRGDATSENAEASTGKGEGDTAIP